jgi:hypothetical protein
MWLGILASTSRRGRCRPESQQALFVPLAIGRLCTQVVSLDRANGEVSIDGQIGPSPARTARALTAPNSEPLGWGTAGRSRERRLLAPGSRRYFSLCRLRTRGARLRALTSTLLDLLTHLAHVGELDHPP